MKRKIKACEEKKADLPNPLAKGRKPLVEDNSRERETARIRDFLLHLDLTIVAKEINKDNITNLAELLFDDNQSVRTRAAMTLGFVAQNKGDIIVAIPLLGKAISDKDRLVREHAVKALRNAATNGNDIAIAVPELVKALEDETTVMDAVEALGSAAYAGTDISEAIPAFVKLLDNLNDKVRELTGWALVVAAYKGTDISITLPSLVNMLVDWNVILRRNAASALGGAADHGADISPAISLLVKSLEDDDFYMRMHATIALGNAADKILDLSTVVKPIVRILKDGNERGYVTVALEKVVAAKNASARRLIVNELANFMYMDWFQNEMVKNSVKFEAITSGIARLFENMRQAEVAQA